jgi:putative membrane protein
MILESLLAFAHIAAVLGLVVFATSETALTREEWLNAAVVHRLVRVDLLCRIAAGAVLLTGLARIYFGMKGAAWYWGQPLLHAKLALYVVLAGMSFLPTRSFQAWQRRLVADGSLPAPEAIRRVRRRLMASTHLLIVVPLLAALLARGVWAR